MHINDVLKYGHGELTKAVDGLAFDHWETGGVCGVWSVKNVIAHLASHELLLVDMFNLLNGETATPHIARYSELRMAYNDVTVDERKNKTPEDTLAEYVQAAEKAMALAKTIPEETARRTGIFPWYGEEYDLEDMVAYSVYGHKREHSAQINVFRDSLKTP